MTHASASASWSRQRNIVDNQEKGLWCNFQLLREKTYHGGSHVSAQLLTHVPCLPHVCSRRETSTERSQNKSRLKNVRTQAGSMVLRMLRSHWFIIRKRHRDPQINDNMNLLRHCMRSTGHHEKL